jgi:hypothetical protein
MGIASTYQSTKTKLAGDSFSSCYYTNAKGHIWTKLEDIIDSDLAKGLVPGKHITYPPETGDDWCLVMTEKFGNNVFRNTQAQVEAFFANKKQGNGGGGPQQKTIDSLQPPAQEQPPAVLHRPQVAQRQAQPPNTDVIPINRAAIMLKWKFWEDQAGLDMLRRNDEAGWIIEKLDTRDDGHLVLMRRREK